jgi:hypothetical protein
MLKPDKALQILENIIKKLNSKSTSKLKPSVVSDDQDSKSQEETFNNKITYFDSLHQ